MQTTLQVCQGCTPVHSSMSLWWGVYDRLEPFIWTRDITNANSMYNNMFTCINAYSSFVTWIQRFHCIILTISVYLYNLIILFYVSWCQVQIEALPLSSRVLNSNSHSMVLDESFLKSLLKKTIQKYKNAPKNNPLNGLFRFCHQYLLSLICYNNYLVE